MSLEVATLAYAGAVGAASFFSPCSVGLLPGYIGYFLAAKQDPHTHHPLAHSTRQGIQLALAASAGFFALFLALALLIRILPLDALTPALPYVSLAIGAAIILLGAYLLLGGHMGISLPRLPVERTSRSVFLFGLAYALASLGCTFPLFLSVLLGATATGNALTGGLAVVAYAAGMAVVMVAITTALSISQESTTRFLRRAVPVVQRAAPIVMIIGGAFVLYYWIDILRTT